MLVLQLMCWANQCWQLLGVSGPLESTTRVQEAIITFHPSQSQIEGGVPELFKRFLAPWENSTDGNGKYPLLILVLTLVPPMARLLCGRGRRGSFAYTVNSISVSEWIKPFWRAAGHRRRVSTAWPPAGVHLEPHSNCDTEHCQAPTHSHTDLLCDDIRIRISQRPNVGGSGKYYISLLPYLETRWFKLRSLKGNNGVWTGTVWGADTHFFPPIHAIHLIHCLHCFQFREWT